MAAPLKMVFPRKGSIFSRVTEQLSHGSPKTQGVAEGPVCRFFRWQAACPCRSALVSRTLFCNAFDVQCVECKLWEFSLLAFFCESRLPVSPISDMQRPCSVVGTFSRCCIVPRAAASFFDGNSLGGGHVLIVYWASFNC